MEIVLLWLVFGIVGAVVASNKNRSAFGWFFLGILFPPALLILLVQKKIDKSIQVAVTQQATTTPTESTAQAKATPDAQPVAGNQPAVTSMSEPEIKDHRITFPEEIQCPVCAEAIKGAAKICRFCNHSLAEWRANFIRQAEEVWNHIDKGHENFPASQMLATGNYHNSEGTPEKAIAYWRLVIQRYPGTEEAKLAHAHLGN